MTWTGRVSKATEATIERLVAHPLLSLLIILVLTGATGWWGAGIPIRSDMEDLFPENTPNVVRAREARRLVGSHSSMQVYVGSPDRAVNRAAAEDLARRLREHSELIRSVEFHRDISFFKKNALLFVSIKDLKELEGKVDKAIQTVVRRELSLDDDLDEPSPGKAKPAKSQFPTEAELEKKYGVEGLTEYRETPDGKVAGVMAYPTMKPADTQRTRRLMDAVNADIAAVKADFTGKHLSFAVDGDYNQVSEAVDQITRDLGRSTTVAFVIIAIILVAYFRRIRAILLVVVPLIVGIAWTIGFARASVGYLNLITAFIFSILLGLGIDFAVHANSRADEEFARGKSLEDALPSALSRLGRPMMGAALTTVATFLGLTIFKFRGFSQFGFIAAAGVLLCLAAVYLTLPPLVLVFHRIRPRKRTMVHRSDHAAAPPSRALAWTMLGVFVGLAAFAAAGLPRLRFEADMRKMRTKVPHQQAELSKKFSNEAVHHQPSPALILTNSLAETRQVADFLEAKKARDALIARITSIYSFVPHHQQEKLAIIRETKRKLMNKYGLLKGQDKKNADTLRRYLDPEPFGVTELPGWIKQKFTDTEGHLGRFVLVSVRGIKSKARHVLAIERDIGTVHVGGKTYYATASWMILGDAFLLVSHEGPWAVGLGALVVLLLVIIDMRHLRDIALTFTPLLVGFLIFLGALAWAGIHLNLFNIVILPTIFGIGVDTSIHLVHRLREGCGVGELLRTTGGAAGISALTTAVGFASLLVVSNEGLRSIGWVAVIGIAASYITSVVLISAVATLASRPVLGDDRPAEDVVA